MVVFELFLVLGVTTTNRRLILFDLDSYQRLPAEVSASPTPAEIKRMTRRAAISALKVILSPEIPLFNAASVMTLATITNTPRNFLYFFVGDDQGFMEIFKLIDPQRSAAKELIFALRG
jgi:hypothetical protein